ncbi:MAG TPA: prepilin-type N-terminal cleavage/methylation domain-containing protein [Chthoniobacterales bacterium]|nr:prepilin-type N-terminal cleavage/methylation domain-containing protein [Chthoniobacterales bacterium]
MSAVIDRDSAAFTLIELIVVIMIIAVLVGLSFPVYQGVQNSAKKTQAKNDVTQIVTAVNAFYTEYGRYPIDSTVITDTGATFGQGSSNSRVLFDTLRGKTTTLNTRQIVFISPPEDTNQDKAKGKIGRDGQFYDPWGSAYLVRMDANYDNEVDNPYYPDTTAGPEKIRQGVLGWSLGKNGVRGGGSTTDPSFGKEPGAADKYQGSGDVISWQ